ncbi:hypothetical protein A6U86_32240 [Rhizobium sp. AC27/96]|uniref:hypothetical protein n=1 Tax=Rhizobium sp. AC27/96 TaxID=1841653 RepID=UPI000828BE90|nr:hypothetical protein [Rhizobium sp. AC27/96]OCJ02453.1 hypothetical protein A6U86_32240 [Rhizobium sp. AC27/96]
MHSTDTISRQVTTSATDLGRLREILKSGDVQAAIALLESSQSISSGSEENHELLEGHEALHKAHEALRNAKDDLEWLADEWRHRWPLAPEEILEGMNAHISRDANAERDILGRYIMRDTSVLTKRLSRKYREKNATMCFSVLTPEEAEERMAFWISNVPNGRTPKSLAEAQGRRDKIIAELKHKLVLAREYSEETNRLRGEAKVDLAKQRIASAVSQIHVERQKISRLTAFTHVGLRIKAEALREGLFFQAGMVELEPVQEMIRFIETAIELNS